VAVGTVDGLWYEVEGEGEAVVLVHAGIADSRMWNPQWEALVAHHRVVRFDARGFGSSGPMAAPFSPAEDVLVVMNHLGLLRTALVGCSMGAGVAVDVAVTHPERVTRLVAAGSGAAGLLDPTPELKAAWAEVEEAYEHGDLLLGNELDVRMWVDGPTRGPDEVDPLLRAIAIEMNGRIWDRDEPGENVRKLEPPAGLRLDAITCPVLAIAGALDQPYVNECARLLAAGVADGRFEVIEGAAHLMNMERPEEFNRLVTAFLQP
jgi:pimeloyl-ACP methyl ester carboxylesterase